MSLPASPGSGGACSFPGAEEIFCVAASPRKGLISSLGRRSGDFNTYRKANRSQHAFPLPSPRRRVSSSCSCSTANCGCRRLCQGAGTGWGGGRGVRPDSLTLLGVRVLPGDSVIAGFPKQRATPPQLSNGGSVHTEGKWDSWGCPEQKITSIRTGPEQRAGQPSTFSQVVAGSGCLQKSVRMLVVCRAPSVLSSQL